MPMNDMDKQAFFDKYAAWAMEQQQKYGIPASVTLAQAAIESSWGESTLSKEDKNMFGIHATRGWVTSGRPYVERNDMGMVKFCKYDSEAESFEHHSRFLMENRRYARCFTYASDDHARWAQAICDAGYAHRPPGDPDRYAKTIEAIINGNHLERYDRMAIDEAQRRGIEIGYMRGQADDFHVSSNRQEQDKTVLSGRYAFPLSGEMVMTDGFGRNATSYRGHIHNGIDLRANHEEVFATEDDGKVVSVGSDATSGKYVIVAYDRPDGSKWRVSYCHLSGESVSEGDTVSAGMKVGVSGNTGNSTAPHLHLTVKRQEAGETSFKAVDPLGYLAEIAVAGSLDGTVVRKGSGEDLLADLKQDIHIGDSVRRQVESVSDDGSLLASRTQSSDPKDWLALLMASHGGGADISQGGGLSGLISALFMGVVALAMQLDHGDSGMQEDSRKSVPALTENPADLSTVIERRRHGADVNALRQTASLNFDIDYPEEQQANNVRLA